MGVSRHIPAAPESPNTRRTIKGICLCAATRTGPQSRQKHCKKHEHMVQHFPAWQTATANTFGDKIRLGKQSWRKNKAKYELRKHFSSRSLEYLLCNITRSIILLFLFLTDLQKSNQPRETLRYR